jgi:hypothetical protein
VESYYRGSPTLSSGRSDNSCLGGEFTDGTNHPVISYHVLPARHSSHCALALSPSHGALGRTGWLISVSSAEFC